MSSTPVFSFSRLKTLDQCEFQYARRYGDRSYSARESIEAFVGKTVHSIIEADHGPLQKTDLDLISAVAERFDREHSSENHYDVKAKGLSHWRSHALTCFQNYLRIGRVREGWRLHAIEKKLAMPLSLTPMCSIMGILDRAIAREPQAGDLYAPYEIHDFKTGRKQPERYFLEDHQLPLYSALLVHALNLPEDSVMRCSRIYLGEGQIASIMVDRARREEALAWARDRARRALEFERRYAETRMAETTVTPLCGWCVYRAGCPAHQAAPSSAPRASEVM